MPWHTFRGQRAILDLPSTLCGFWEIKLRLWLITYTVSVYVWTHMYVGTCVRIHVVLVTFAIA